MNQQKTKVLFLTSEIAPFNSTYQLERLITIAKENKLKPNCALHIDTGMNRLGINGNQIKTTIPSVTTHRKVNRRKKISLTTPTVKIDNVNRNRQTTLPHKGRKRTKTIHHHSNYP